MYKLRITSLLVMLVCEKRYGWEKYVEIMCKKL